MKSITYFIITILLLLISCNKYSNTLEVNENKLLAKVSIVSNPSYFDADSNKLIEIETLAFNGELISENITSINFILAGNDTIPFEDSYSIDRKNYGVIYFDSPSNLYIKPESPINFIINTKIGVIEGNVVLPDSIYNVHYSKIDTVAEDDSIEITFNGNAQYYISNYALFYQLSDSNNFYNDFGEIISKTPKFKLTNKEFSRLGNLQIGFIEMYNGPYLEEGSKGNMAGDGSGYLYASKKQWLHKSFTIVK